MKKFILFDHDGVLVETEHWFYMAYKRALKEIGITLSLTTYLDNMSQGISSWDLAKEAGIEQHKIDASLVNRHKYYQDHLLSENIKIKGIVEALSKLAPHYKMAIVTTSKRSDFELIHSDKSIVKFMDFVLTREDYEKTKPHPEPYLTALKRLGANHSQVIVVEDSARGLKSAIAADLDCIVVNSKFTATNDFTGALLIIDTLSALPSAIEKLNNA